MTTTKQAELEQARDELRDILQRCSTVYAVVHHVSRSGMQRRIEFYVMDEWWESGDRIEPHAMRRISHLVAKVRGSRMTDEGVIVNGCGMDMGWNEIYSCRFSLGLGEMRRNSSRGIRENPDEVQFVAGYGFDLRYL